MRGHQRLYSRVVTAALISAVAGSSYGQTSTPETHGAAGPTKAQAAELFNLDVMLCLYSLEHGGGIADIPPGAKPDLRPAAPAERFLFKDPATKVWATDRYGGQVVLAELSPDRCKVFAVQLPVEATFQYVLAQLRRTDPELKSEPVKLGGWPIAYQLEATENGSRFSVHLEGSNPGGMAHPWEMLNGHASRYSLLFAEVKRQPLAKP